MKNYTKQTNFLGQEVIFYEEDGISYSFMADPANSDYQAYLKSIEDEANTL